MAHLVCSVCAAKKMEAELTVGLCADCHNAGIAWAARQAFNSKNRPTIPGYPPCDCGSVVHTNECALVIEMKKRYPLRSKTFEEMGPKTCKDCGVLWGERHLPTCSVLVGVKPPPDPFSCDCKPEVPQRHEHTYPQAVHKVGACRDHEEHVVISIGGKPTQTSVMYDRRKVTCKRCLTACEICFEQVEDSLDMWSDGNLNAQGHRSCIEARKAENARVTAGGNPSSPMAFMPSPIAEWFEAMKEKSKEAIKEVALTSRPSCDCGQLDIRHAEWCKKLDESPPGVMLKADTKMVRNPDGRWREAREGEQHEAVVAQDTVPSDEPPVMVPICFDAIKGNEVGPVVDQLKGLPNCTCKTYPHMLNCQRLIAAEEAVRRNYSGPLEQVASVMEMPPLVREPAILVNDVCAWCRSPISHDKPVCDSCLEEQASFKKCEKMSGYPDCTCGRFPHDIVCAVINHARKGVDLFAGDPTAPPVLDKVEESQTADNPFVRFAKKLE